MTKPLPLSNVRIVLSHPSEPRNIGATCRAIKNFGITQLVIVSETEFDRDVARRLAVGAFDVLDSAEKVPTLEAAIDGSVLVAGVSRRTGQKRKQVPFAPWQLAAKVASLGESLVSIVLGNEQSGLSDAELELCHLAVLIPSAPDFPSLNLSHAVQIIVYELSKVIQEDAGRAVRRPITVSEIDGTVDKIVGSLNSLGYHTQEGPQGMNTFLNEIVARASLSASEAQRLVDLFAKLEGMHGS